MDHKLAASPENSSRRSPRKRYWFVLWAFLAVTIGASIVAWILAGPLSNQGWTSYTNSNSGPVGNEVAALAVDSQGRVWVGRAAGLSVLGLDGAWTHFSTTNSGLIDDHVNAVTVDNSGGVWVGTAAGLSQLHPNGTWASYTEPNSGPHANEVDALAVDNQGRLWVGNAMGLRMLAPDGRWTFYTKSNSGLGVYGAAALAADSQGRVWVGSQDGLRHVEPNGDWMTYGSSNSGVVPSEVDALVVDSRGQVWVGTVTTGLWVLLPDSSWRSDWPYLGLAAKKVTALAVDSQDRIWAGGAGGLNVRGSDGTWTSYTTSNSGLSDGRVAALAVDGRDRVWVGSPSGLNELDQQVALSAQALAGVRNAPTLLMLAAAVDLLIAAYLGWRALPERPELSPDDRRKADVAGALVAAGIAGFGTVLGLPLLAHGSGQGYIFLYLCPCVMAIPAAALGAVLARVAVRLLRQIDLSVAGFLGGVVAGILVPVMFFLWASNY